MATTAVTNAQAQASVIRSTYKVDRDAQTAVVAAASESALEAEKTKLRLIEAAYRAAREAERLADLLT